jgi:hypothetical protein
MPATRSWIKQFCHAQPILVEIDRSFIEDSFNLYGLKQLVHDFSIAMCIILDKKRKLYPHHISWFFCFLLLANETYTRDMIQSAMLLYGLIHARFICTSRGLELMVSEPVPRTSHPANHCCRKENMLMATLVFARDIYVTHSTFSP